MKLILILDPEIFFISLEGKYFIHPILRSWYEQIKTHKDIDELNVYFLARTQNRPTIRIHASTDTFSIPIRKRFFDLLSDESLEYIQNLSKGKLLFADMHHNAPTGISGFSDGRKPAVNEMLVVTADPLISYSFKDKSVTVVEMEPPSRPHIDDSVSISSNNADCRVYCDFDGTLYNFDSYQMLDRIKLMTTNRIEKTKTIQKIHDKLTEVSDLQLINEQTVQLLCGLRAASIYLITQREYHSDAKQHPYNCASKVVAYINNQYQLNIQCSEAKFLNGNGQLHLSNKYKKKIEVIYQDFLLLPEAERPKNILLIDDNIGEMLMVDHFKPHFAALGTTVNTCFIMHPYACSDLYLNDLRQFSSPIFNIIDQYKKKELGKLDDGFLSIKEVQENYHKTEIKVSLATNKAGLFSSEKNAVPIQKDIVNQDGAGADLAVSPVAPEGQQPSYPICSLV